MRLIAGRSQVRVLFHPSQTMLWRDRFQCGRVAQRESARFASEMSRVRFSPRPLLKASLTWIGDAFFVSSKGVCRSETPTGARIQRGLLLGTAIGLTTWLLRHPVCIMQKPQ